MDYLTGPKKKRRAATLQLAPMIDIFVLIIVFLVKGTSIGGVTTSIPAELEPASSKSPEPVESAAEIFLMVDKISFVMIKQDVSKDDFYKNEFQLPPIQQQLKTYIEQIPAAQKKSGILVNLIADRRVPYEFVFEVSKFLRETGFQNVLYVAQGEMK